jgi:hypothetical protein
MFLRAEGSNSESEDEGTFVTHSNCAARKIAALLFILQKKKMFSRANVCVIAKADDLDLPLTLSHAIVLLKDDFPEDIKVGNAGNESGFDGKDEVGKMSLEHPARVMLKHLVFGGCDAEEGGEVKRDVEVPHDQIV